MTIDAQILPRIKMVAPGTRLRRALDHIVRAEFGALVVFLDDIKAQEDILQGGFYIGASFSPEKLYELAKMDGAIILDESVSRILAANVQLAPDPNLPTDETGMRHRAAERVARQTGKFVVTVSRRRRVITLYYKHHKHQLHEIGHLINRLNQTIRTVERYKSLLDEKAAQLGVEEILDQIQPLAVLEVIGKAVGILHLLEEAAPHVIEIGDEGHLPAMRLAGIGVDVRELLELVIEDYGRDQGAAACIDQLKGDGGPGLAPIARCLGWPATGEAELQEMAITARGYRLLRQVANIPPATADHLVARFHDLTGLSRADADALREVEGVGRKRAQAIIAGIRQMRSRGGLR